MKQYQNKALNRWISSLTLALYLTTLALPCPQAEAMGVSFSSIHSLHKSATASLPFSFPEDLGWVKDAYIPNLSEGIKPAANPVQGVHPFVIHIQDAHANPDAQKQISALLWHIKNNISDVRKWPMMVAVEGAAGPLHAEYFDFFQEYQNVNDSLVQDLMQKGEVSGPELFAWEIHNTDKRLKGTPAGSQGTNVQLIGSENPELYRRNLKQYREILFRRDEIAVALAKVEPILEKTGSQVLSPDLREFLKERSRRKFGDFGSDQNSPQLMSYIQYLTSTAQSKLELDLTDPMEQLRFPNISRILALMRMDGKVDRKTALAQEEALRGELGRRTRTEEERNLVIELKNLGQSAGSLTPRLIIERVVTMMRRHHISPQDYPLYWDWAGQVILRSEIDTELLYAEMAVVEGWLVDTIAKNESEKKYVSLYQDFQSLRSLLHLELTADEFSGIEKAADNLRPSLMYERLTELNRNQAKEGPAVDETVRQIFEPLDRWYGNAFDFYRDAKLRDEVIFNNSLTALNNFMKEQPSAQDGTAILVLITGGFHTKGLIRKAEQAGLGYAVIQPRITQVDGGKLYRSVMKGENADLSAYFSGHSFDKRESLFLKGLVENAVPQLWEKEKLPFATIGEQLSLAVNRHPVLSKKIKSKAIAHENKSSVEFHVPPQVRSTNDLSDEAEGLPAESYTINTPQIAGEVYLWEPLDAEISSTAATLPFDYILDIASAGVSVTVRPVQTTVTVVSSGAPDNDLPSTLTNYFFFGNFPLYTASVSGDVTNIPVDEGMPYDIDSYEREPAGLRAEVRAEIPPATRQFHKNRAEELVQFANAHDGALPISTHEIKRFFRFKDMKLILQTVPPQDRARYLVRAIRRFTELKTRNEKIISGVMAGGAASRMMSGELPVLVIQAMQEDPEQFVDMEKLEEDEEVKREVEMVGLKEYMKSLKPLENKRDHDFFDKVLHAPKALLPAAKVDGVWYSFIGYRLLNIFRANEQLEKMGLGRPYVAQIMMNDGNYRQIIQELDERKFYGLKVSVIRGAKGKIVDIDHNDLTNELVVYNQKLTYRKIAPLATVEAQRREDQANRAAAQTATDDKKRKDYLDKILFKTNAAYEYARQYSETNQGNVLFDHAHVPGGHADRYAAMLETTEVGRKVPMIIDLYKRRIKHDEFQNIDNMGMNNEDKLVIMGFMLENDYAYIFEGASRPAGQAGGGYDYTPYEVDDATIFRARQTEDALMAASTKISPEFDPKWEMEEAKKVLKGGLPNVVPINTATVMDHLPQSREDILNGRDVFSANLTQEQRIRFADALENEDVEELAQVANLFRANLGLLATKKVIKDPALQNPADGQIILTVIDEGFAWEAQQGHLKAGKVAIVGVGSVVDVTDRNFPADQSRFAPLKTRGNFGDKALQAVREALVQRVVKGRLFSREFGVLSGSVLQSIDQNLIDRLYESYVRASKDAAEDADKKSAEIKYERARSIRYGALALSELLTDEEQRRLAGVLYTRITRDLLEYANRTSEIIEQYQNNKDQGSDIANLNLRNQINIFFASSDPGTSLYDASEYVLKEFARIDAQSPRSEVRIAANLESYYFPMQRPQEIDRTAAKTIVPDYYLPEPQVKSELKDLTPDIRSFDRLLDGSVIPTVKASREIVEIVKGLSLNPNIQLTQEETDIISFTADEVTGKIYSVGAVTAYYKNQRISTAEAAPFAVTFIVESLNGGILTDQDLRAFDDAEVKDLTSGEDLVHIFFQPAVPGSVERERKTILNEHVTELPEIDDTLKPWVRFLAINRNLTWSVDVENVSESGAKDYVKNFLLQAEKWGTPVSQGQVVIHNLGVEGFDPELISQNTNNRFLGFLAGEERYLSAVPIRKGVEFRLLTNRRSAIHSVADRLLSAEALLTEVPNDFRLHIASPGDFARMRGWDYEGILQSLRAYAKLAAAA